MEPLAIASGFYCARLPAALTGFGTLAGSWVKRVALSESALADA